ncbi:diaminobutyrate--2-oxoglutarate transaminase [Photorhabdus temperata]|uniref:Diaminobutyrate--2-oxoglutarate transaminase n=1 Tax=Photorhabdus temperata subsp. temperata Meg1 TaxID=1393735 RepID=A0A081RZ68_PHOTE|nr:diaminobutyrate--2-oxoglutarate transaminase [Photorhabdus temperata]KER03971.1 diaminobutyrate aminotransferase apoenzyme [Photorhabdus temperata subsp. temperata Meg1]MCT8347119.1 diaminobutyrate--2-oxoglutarate transaminase [Photorhabdus temperata]
MDIFAKYESGVQSYSRSFPRVFHHAQDDLVFDKAGASYIDFLSGAGALNYGHNNPVLKERLIEYIRDNGITHGLDLHTVAKGEFLETFVNKILQPRALKYVVQFTGPTGTNAVEAALKLARKVTGRQNVIAFTNGFHGVSLGALATTGNSHHRAAAGIVLTGVTRMPYDGYLGEHIDTTVFLNKVLGDTFSGIDLPAAIIVETVQGEGGVNAAKLSWLKNLSAICQKYGVILIVDEVQAGCGRTGHFFSFESAGIIPDIVTMSKSLSGYGLPFAVVLIHPELDKWQPGEHNGTFRGNNLAFVTAKAAIDNYWIDNTFALSINTKSEYLTHRLKSMANKFGEGHFIVCGRGMLQGINCITGLLASRITRKAFSKGLIIETSGADNQVIKCLSPLTISQKHLEDGLNILEESMAEVCSVSAIPS